MQIFENNLLQKAREYMQYALTSYQMQLEEKLNLLNGNISEGIQPYILMMDTQIGIIEKIVSAESFEAMIQQMKLYIYLKCG